MQAAMDSELHPSENGVTADVGRTGELCPYSRGGSSSLRRSCYRGALPTALRPVSLLSKSPRSANLIGVEPDTFCDSHRT